MHRRKLALGTVLAPALLLPFPTLAQRGDDDGEYQILRARYGTDRNNVDVTERLRELARRDQRFRMGNNTFGVDPDPGRTKTLRIYTRTRDGQHRTFEYKEGSHVDGAQFTGWRGGRWGDDNGSGGWNGPGGDDGEYTILSASYGTNRNEVDVTSRLRELARRDERLRMGNDTFGVDPDPGRTKTLRIHTRDRNGQPRTFEYKEGSYVDGNQFIGWRGGNWGHGGAGHGGWNGNGRPGRLNIVSASYGANGRSHDVTARLRSLVRDEQFRARVDNELTGTDPAPGKRKTLTVTYTLGGGMPQTVRVQERDELSLP